MNVLNIRTLHGNILKSIFLRLINKISGLTAKELKTS